MESEPEAGHRPAVEQPGGERADAEQRQDHQQVAEDLHGEHALAAVGGAHRHACEVEEQLRGGCDHEAGGDQHHDENGKPPDHAGGIKSLAFRRRWSFLGC